MALEMIHHSEQKARKAYHDDGWEEIQEWRNGGYYTNRRPNKKADDYDIHLIEKAMFNAPHRIEKGDEYQRQFNKIDGDAGVWRTKSLFYNMFRKYDLFPEY